jgi:hypothetical protein
MEVDQITEGLDAFQLARDRLTTQVEVTLDATGPGLAVFAVAEGLA